jgi:uncharacterized protein YigE (DUF2233 family)
MPDRVFTRQAGSLTASGMAFRDRLQCTEALYLDGAVSRLYARGVTGPPSSGDAFAALIAVLAKD